MPTYLQMHIQAVSEAAVTYYEERLDLYIGLSLTEVILKIGCQCHGHMRCSYVHARVHIKTLLQAQQ